jgi:predicted transcriptional regulator
MSVLLSIKPKYVEQIENGSKLYEFRRVIFKQDIDEIYVYATAPIKQIVGKICIDEIIEDTPKNLWGNFKQNAGINKKDFFEYFSGKEKGYAIKIKDFISFEKPIDPYQENPKFVPPQSYAYLDNILPMITV